MMKVLEHTQIEDIAKDYLYQFQIVFLQEQLYSDREAGEIFSVLRKKAIRQYEKITGTSMTTDEFYRIVWDLPEPLKEGIIELAKDDVDLGRTKIIRKNMDGTWRV
ncbi:hypothetical protein G8J22_02159 [Lentilactobacillus hilgardii]|uniref:hypothetical protein n=1 Tax=Lentilactobacillus hilgardii TaxID=1588 RepID=UPI00019C5918|nr:hypothetical protein [Lentilactobacillus hilgardii]EEI19365.1 hypothetical protein HMPREF0497_1850 [Lentilactobacillus buchneri ATCC 11577]MCT3396065.1 hypothetical protein [Lentilactobacillus hilgardii]QIR10152.1 hypothetical protein G8J22_02159 [Lentilactobacillus hilgardii]